jgi:excisionase family DNA binding protein
MESVLLRIPEAAQRLGLSRTMAYQMVRRGELPVVRIGRAVRVPLHALELWVAANTTGGEIEGIDRADRRY